jgi:L-asparaginase
MGRRQQLTGATRMDPNQAADDKLVAKIRIRPDDFPSPPRRFALHIPMSFFTGKSSGRVVLLHGGAPSSVPESGALQSAVQVLIAISQQCFDQLDRQDVCEATVNALEAMEADPQFNAGFGGTIQSDGKVRVSASLMDGTRQSFSGVLNALDIKHPSLIARWLQGQRYRVVGHPGVETLARELNLPTENLVTEARLAEWRRGIAEGTADTVGCVVRDSNGHLAAGTSTGGRPLQYPGRVTDSVTVAGNYASSDLAVSTTGIGEEIVDDALAARLETRCRDGMCLEEAARRCFDEARERSRNYGWIAVHRDGGWVAAHTTPTMSFVVRGDGQILCASAGAVCT